MVGKQIQNYSLYITYNFHTFGLCICKTKKNSGQDKEYFEFKILKDITFKSSLF